MKQDQIHVLRKGGNESFQVGHSTGWCPDQLVLFLKFRIPMIKAPLLEKY